MRARTMVWITAVGALASGCDVPAEGPADVEDRLRTQSVIVTHCGGDTPVDAFVLGPDADNDIVGLAEPRVCAPIDAVQCVVDDVPVGRTVAARQGAAFGASRGEPEGLALQCDESCARTVRVDAACADHGTVWVDVPLLDPGDRLAPARGVPWRRGEDVSLTGLACDYEFAVHAEADGCAAVLSDDAWSVAADVKLEHSASWRLRVTSEETGAPIAGAWADSVWWAPPVSGADGTLVVNAVPPERLTVTAPGREAVTLDLLSNDTARTIEVSLGELKRFDVDCLGRCDEVGVYSRAYPRQRERICDALESGRWRCLARPGDTVEAFSAGEWRSAPLLDPGVVTELAP